MNIRLVVSNWISHSFVIQHPATQETPLELIDLAALPENHDAAIDLAQYFEDANIGVD